MPGIPAGKGAMEYSQAQMQQFKQEFKKRRNRQLLVGLLLVVPILIVGALGDRAKEQMQQLPPVLVQSAIAVAAVGVIGLALVNWRCPACKGYLGRRLNPKFCGNCGVPLR
jgi:hypothetical protein